MKFPKNVQINVKLSHLYWNALGINSIPDMEVGYILAMKRGRILLWNTPYLSLSRCSNVIGSQLALAQAVNQWNGLLVYQPLIWKEILEKKTP